MRSPNIRASTGNILYLLWLLTTTLATITSGCSRVAHTQVIDLVSRLESAETSSVMTPLLDFGTGSGKAHIVYGFHWADQIAKTGDTFLWSDGNGSQLSFDLVKPQTLTLSLRCRPNQQLEFPVKKLTLELNDQAIGQFTLKKEWSEYRVEVPQDVVRPGPNFLTIGYKVATDPRTEEPSDSPPLVAWDWIKIEPTVEQARTLSADGADWLFLPVGSTASYYLKLKPGSMLETGKMTSVIEPGQPNEATELEVVIQYEGTKSRTLILDEQQSLNLSLDSGTELIKMSLSPRSKDPEAQTTNGLKLRPRILEPMPPTKEESTPSVSRRPNIVLYLVDTLRADHVGCYGYPKSTTPRLDEFAADATVFKRMQAQSSWTKTSVASIVSGQLPRTHGVLSFEDVLASPYALAEMLRELGYVTGGFNTNDWVTKEFGYARGYDHYETNNGEPSEKVNQRTLQWLDSVPSGKPFFLYLHTLDPHAPYDPPEKYRLALAPDVDPALGPQSRQVLNRIKRRDESATPELTADLTALYDGEIACNDNSFGLLLDALKERDLYEDTLIIFVSDHGEEFGEHGYWAHGSSLYSEVLNVPLVIRFPDSLGRGRSVKSLVSHVDILPTLLNYLGAEIPSSLPGQSLLPMVEHIELDISERASYSTLKLAVTKDTAPSGFSYSIEMDGIIEGNHSLIRTWQHHLIGQYAPIELYDVLNDPNQANPIETRPILQGYLLSNVRHLVNSAADNTQEVDQRLVRERLKSLPYL